MTTALVPALQSNWLVMHVTVMMLSYGALLSGCLLAICYLIVAFFHPLSLVQTENKIAEARLSLVKRRTKTKTPTTFLSR
jgi:ABC-type transport system involved in cytochrome c biogenesis permease subunit